MKKIFLLLAIAVTALISVSCQDDDSNETLNVIENGLYVGSFNGSAVIYEVSNSKITPLGYSPNFVGSIVIDNQSFVTKFPGDYNPKSVVCSKTNLKKTDYESAVLNSEKEFCGLHYAHNSNDITGADNNGLLFAIKSGASGKMEITIIKVGHSTYYKTEGTLSNETYDQKAYRKLSFTVPSEITNEGTEEWSLTLNPVTGYTWSNLFMLSANNEMRFQVEVIDNGLE